MGKDERPADIELTTSLHIAKARCVTEMKILAFDDTIITQATIDWIRFEAEEHGRRHPSHQVEITIYEHAPETLDIP